MPDAKGVSECNQTDSLDEGQAGVSPFEELHGINSRLKHQVGDLEVGVAAGITNTPLMGAVYLIGQYIQQHLHADRKCLPNPVPGPIAMKAAAPNQV